MLSIGKLRHPDDYLDGVAAGREDYYTGHGETPGRWTGAAVVDLGLAGTVDADALRAVLDGDDPRTGKRLAATNRRLPGYDLCGSRSEAEHALVVRSSALGLDVGQDCRRHLRLLPLQ